MRVRDAESRVPAPRPSRRVRRKASRALRGVRTRRHQRPEPREEEARLRSAAGALPDPCPALFPVPSHADAPGCSRERVPGRGGRRAPRSPAWASLSRFPLPRGAWAQPALGAAFSRPGLLRFSRSPSPFALLSFFPGHFSPPSSHSLPASVRVPSSAWLPRREAEATPAPKDSLTRSSRLAFNRAWPSEMGEERESRSLAFSPSLGRGRSQRSVPPSSRSPRIGRPSA